MLTEDQMRVLDNVLNYVADRFEVNHQLAMLRIDIEIDRESNDLYSVKAVVRTNREWDRWLVEIVGDALSSGEAEQLSMLARHYVQVSWDKPRTPTPSLNPPF